MSYEDFERGQQTRQWAREKCAARKAKKGEKQEPKPEPRTIYPRRAGTLEDEHTVYVDGKEPSVRTLMKRIGI